MLAIQSRVGWTRSRYVMCAIYRVINAESLTALATFFIAAFTFTLWWSTRNLWLAHRETHEATQRAFVHIDGFNYELTTAADRTPVDVEYLPERYKSQPELYVTRFAFQPRWKNSGNTPTKNMTIQVAWRGPLGPIPPDYTYEQDPASFFLAPKSVDASEFIQIPTQTLIDYGLNPAGAEPIIFLWGRTDYEDVFGKPHFIHWCYRLRYERYKGERLQAGFIQWGNYNRSDEDGKG
jgi:hypothetical protein